MHERLVSHASAEDEANSQLALFEKLVESGDTTGLFALYQGAQRATEESKHTTDARAIFTNSLSNYASLFRRRGLRAEPLEDAWHAAHVLRAENNPEPRPTTTLPNDIALSQAISAILTAESIDALDEQMAILDDWSRRIHEARCDSELSDDLLSIYRQINTILVNCNHYEARLFTRIEPASTADER